MRTLRLSAGVLLFGALAGCVTVEDLDRQAMQRPLSNSVVKSDREAKLAPLPAGRLVGKWSGDRQSQELLWADDGTARTFPVKKFHVEYEFRGDWQSVCREFKDGKLVNETKSRWSYVINDQGIAELTMHDWKHPYWCVFWLGEDEFKMEHRNSDTAIKWRMSGLNGVYDDSWWWRCRWERDKFANEVWVSHHIDAARLKGHRREMHRSPEVCRRVAGPVSDSGRAERQQVSKTAKEQPAAPLYSILSCARESGSDFSYSFVIELTGSDKSLRAFRSVQKEFRAAVKEDYAESFPGVRMESLFVDFPEYKLNNGKIEGRAVVLTISVTSLSYDPATRRGKLAVRVNANQYEEARKWIRRNIETLVRDKNIALVTGEIPPVAKFYLGREELKDGNVLEIEFKTE